MACSGAGLETQQSSFWPFFGTARNHHILGILLVFKFIDGSPALPIWDRRDDCLSCSIRGVFRTCPCINLLSKLLFPVVWGTNASRTAPFGVHALIALIFERDQLVTPATLQSTFSESEGSVTDLFKRSWGDTLSKNLYSPAV